MQKSLSSFIEQLHHYPDYLLEGQLKNSLEETGIKALKDLGLLKRGDDLKEILCNSCENDHFLPVGVEDGRLYYLCPYEDTARNYLASGDVATWNFDIEAFLQQLSLKLGIDASIEKMGVQGLWQIGGFSKDDTRHECYYYQGKRFSEVIAFIKNQPSLMRRYVIFTNKQEVSTIETSHSLLLIEVKDLIYLKNHRLIFNKKLFDKFLINGFRSVIFDEKNGDLIVNGKRIVVVSPATTEYYFADFLWKNFNEPVAHKKIESYIYEKTKKSYADLAGKLCHKQKKKIKEVSEEPTIIDEIFQTTTDLDGNNAYIMRNPS